MNKTEVNSHLAFVGVVRQQHAMDETKFRSDMDAVMRLLLHEAAANFMSVEAIAKATGYTVKSIRSRMRDIGLNPRDGKTVLSKRAAEALANNADLLGIDPSEMDLMSPLAYLPMGAQLRKQLQDQRVSQVHEIDEDVSGNSGYSSIGEAVHDLHLRGGRLRGGTTCPACGWAGSY